MIDTITTSNILLAIIEEDIGRAWSRWVNYSDDVLQHYSNDEVFHKVTMIRRDLEGFLKSVERRVTDASRADSEAPRNG